MLISWPEKQAVHIKDAYLSSYENFPTIAFSAPVLDEKNAGLLGVVVMRVSTKALDKIMTHRTGLGETGEVYLINEAGYMITPSKFEKGTFLKKRIDRGASKADREDRVRIAPDDTEQAVSLYKNYFRSDVLGIHIRIPETGWWLMAEIGAREAFAPLSRLTRAMFLILGILLISATAASFFLARSITRPVIKLKGGAEEIMRGEPGLQSRHP